MNTRPFAALVLALAPVASHADSAVSSEIAALRQTYDDALLRLLKKCIKEGDLAGVEETGLAIKKIRPSFPEVKEGKAPVGHWRWNNNYPAVISPDGFAVWNDKSFGVWKWTNEQKREAQVKWASGYIDTFTISPDGKNLHVTNNHDEKYVVRKIEQSE